MVKVELGIGVINCDFKAKLFYLINKSQSIN